MSGFARRPIFWLCIPVSLLSRAFLLSLFDMGAIVLRNHGLFGRLAFVTSIGAQMLWLPLAWRWPFARHGSERLREQPHIMRVGSADGDRQRDSTRVDQQAAFAVVFSLSVGLAPTHCFARGAFPMARSTDCQRQAMPSICSSGSTCRIPAWRRRSTSLRRCGGLWVWTSAWLRRRMKRRCCASVTFSKSMILVARCWTR
jgi:hypothetical protein